jgi:glutaredoxin
MTEPAQQQPEAAPPAQAQAQPPQPAPSRRLCAVHGLVVGFDGRCVICRREQGDEDESSPGRLVFGALLLFAALGGGVLVLKGVRGRQHAEQLQTAPLVTASAPAEAEDLAPAPPTDDDLKGPSRAANVEAKQRALEAAMLKVPIKMYSANKCPLCDSARAWMKDKQLTFTEVDVAASPADLEALTKISPDKKPTVPTFDVDGEVLVGFGPPTMLAAVRRAAEKRTR